MECLTQLVGLDGCTEGNEPYKLNQFVSESQIEELLSDAYPTVDDWVIATRKFAAQRLASDVVNKVSSAVHVETLLENNIAGRFNDGKKVTTATNFAGIYVHFYEWRAFVKLQLNSISFYGNYDGDIEVKVVDLLNGQELATTTITAVAGAVVTKTLSISVPIAMRETDIGIVYDASAITSYKTTIALNGCSTCSNAGAISRYATFSGMNVTSSFLLGDKSSRNDTAGLSVDYSFVCDQEQWACTMAGKLGLAMLYKTLYELFNSSLNSGSQFSNQQTTNYEQNVERMTSFEYNYGMELDKVLKHARTPDNICFSCNPRIGVRSRLPG